MDVDAAFALYWFHILTVPSGNWLLPNKGDFEIINRNTQVYLQIKWNFNKMYKYVTNVINKYSYNCDFKFT